MKGMVRVFVLYLIFFGPQGYAQQKREWQRLQTSPTSPTTQNDKTYPAQKTYNNFESRHTAHKIFLRLTDGWTDSSVWHTSSRALTGMTTPGNLLSVNTVAVRVYKTGAFGTLLPLKPGINRLALEIKTPDSSCLDTNLVINYQLPEPLQETKGFKIDEVHVYPSGNQQWITGDLVQIRVKASPAMSLTFFRGIPLTELPPAYTGGIRGIYQVNYTIKASDTLHFSPITIEMKNGQGKVIQQKSAEKFGFNDSGFPKMGKSQGQLPYLNFGLGEDRLGGAKLGYIDTAIRLKITARVGELYRCELAKSITAWIPEQLVQLLPKGIFFPGSLTGNIRLTSDSAFNYVKISLNQRLPYSSMVLANPSRIIVKIYGATSNTNWIIQSAQTSTVRGIYCEQSQDEVFSVNIDLAKEQSWGYTLFYEGNQLILKLKHSPQEAGLKKLVIAVDAGHGGTNHGAKGITGALEKDITLAIAKKLEKVLLAAGARVMMTRDTDLDLSMTDRITRLRKDSPDLLISIHANSAGDPETMGNSTYYRYAGFRPLSLCIYQEITSLGLRPAGNIGQFNFGLNGPTEYPNVLVETAFLSSPSDEEKLLDPVFQTLLAAKILDGLNEFLHQAQRPNMRLKSSKP